MPGLFFFNMSQRIKKLENLNRLTEEGLCTYHMDKDACGVGVVANIKGNKSNSIVKNALEVAEILKKNKKISTEIIDLRSINPIDEKTIIRSVNKTKNLCLIEHGWPNASISSDVISKVTEKIKLSNKPIKFCWPNSYTPTSQKLEEKFYFSNYDIAKKIINKL